MRFLKYVCALTACVLSATLSAQVATTPLQCSVTSGVPPVVRAEGFTELASDLVVTCTGGTAGQRQTIDLRLNATTQITSRILTPSNLSEALLFIDEPGLPRTDVAGNSGEPTPLCLSPEPASNSAQTACNPVRSGQTYQFTSFTAFRGKFNELGALVWSDIPVEDPGPNRTRVLRLSNIRVNAQTLGVSETLMPQLILYTVSVTSGLLPLDTPVHAAAATLPGVRVDATSCSGVSGGDAMRVEGCSPSGIQQEFAKHPLSSGSLPAIGGLRFREGFPTAFKSRIIPGQSTYAIGSVFPSESALVRESLGVGGLADTGTRLIARIAGIPAGVRLFVGSEVIAGHARAVLVSGAADSGAPELGTPTINRPAPLPPSVPGYLSCGNALHPMAEVSVTGGSAVAVWEVTQSNPSEIETLVFPYGLAWQSAAGAAITGAAVSTATMGLAPIYVPGGAASSPAGLQIAVPRFATPTTPFGVFSFRGCSTGNSVPVTLTSNRTNTSVSVDGTIYTLPRTFDWVSGSTHALGAPTPAAPPTSSSLTREVYLGWNGTPISTLTTPATATTFEAIFRTQHKVQVTSSDGGIASVEVPDPFGWADEGSTVTLRATPLARWKFSHWTSSGQTTPVIQVIVNGPIYRTAQFAPVMGTCTTEVSPTGLRFLSSGGSDVITVDSRECGPWRARYWSPWLILTGTTEGARTGSFTVQAPANTGTGARVAYVQVGEKRIRISQQGTKPECSTGISGFSAAVIPANGGEAILGVTTSSPDCTWNAAADIGWIVPYPNAGTGSGQSGYSVQPNFSGMPRVGAVSVDGQVLHVHQAAAGGTPDERFIRMLYWNYFGRLPAPSEVQYHRNSGLTRAQLAYNFLISEEFNIGGRFIAGLYAGLLNRDAEYGGWLFQRDALKTNRINPDTAVANFLNSAEFQLNNGTLTNAAFARLMYRQILGREAAQWEVDWRVGLLTSTMTRVQTARDLLNSREFRDGKAARLTAFLLHATLLNRDPSASEMTTRVNEVTAAPNEATLRRIVGEIVSSRELQEVIE